MSVVVSWSVFLIANDWEKDTSPPTGAIFGDPGESLGPVTHARKTGASSTQWMVPHPMLQTGHGVRVSVRAGLPARALGFSWTSYRDEVDGAGGIHHVWTPKDGGLMLPSQWRRQGSVEDRLPVVPLWPGFVIDVMVYGALAWTVLFGWSSWRRRRGCALGAGCRIG